MRVSSTYDVSERIDERGFFPPPIGICRLSVCLSVANGSPADPENTMVKQELATMEEGAAVYKLIGPVLVRGRVSRTLTLIPSSLISNLIVTRTCKGPHPDLY